jgi:hypothetical protein
MNRRCPSLKFHCPVCKGRQGDDDKERTGLTLHFDEIANERDRLDRLSETLLCVSAMSSIEHADKPFRRREYRLVCCYTN